MAKAHTVREVRIFALYSNAVEGTHFAIVRSGTWAQIVSYLNFAHTMAGCRNLFVEQADGSLKPLFA